VFGEKKTPQEMIREQKRINRRSITQLNRQVNQLRREEQKAAVEMKRLAKQGQKGAVKQMARDVVRLRKSQERFLKLRSDVESLNSAMTNAAATQKLQLAMKNVSKTMALVSNQIKLPELQESLRKYQMEAQKMEMNQEMMDDAMDNALEHDDDEEDELVEKVLEEIGLDITGALVDAPKKKITQQDAADEKEEMDEPEMHQLRARLDNLRR
jgi:charged multivesicular body protein 2A